MAKGKNTQTSDSPPQATAPQAPQATATAAPQATATAAPQAAAAKDTQKVKLVKSAIGLFNIVDKVGTSIMVTPELKEKMIAAGVAEVEK